nr:hypothetical protein [Tanacetum cinerariifolium]
MQGVQSVDTRLMVRIVKDVLFYDHGVNPPHIDECCCECGDALDGIFCQQCTCALLRERLEEDLVTYLKYFQNTSESSDDSTNVVNAPREPFVVKQDHGVKSSQNPPPIDKCCCECGDALDGIFCQQCICKSCGKGAHIGHNCPPKVSIIFNPEPCNQTMNNELPQTLPSFDSVPCKQEEKRIEEEQAASARYWKIPACCDDDDDYDSAITPVLSTEEIENSLSMGDEHLDTIPATESDEVIKSSVEDLVLIPSESGGENGCDRLLYDSSSPRPPKEFNSENSNAEIESFSPSPIPNEDSNSFMEEIDLFLTPDDPMPSSIEDDDNDSEGDSLFLERLPHDDPISLPDTLDFSNVVRV